MLKKIKTWLPPFATLRRYSEVLRWLMLDSLYRFKLQAALALIAGFMGVSSQAAAIGQVIFYVRLLEKNENLKIWGYTFQTQSSVELFVLFSGAVAVLLLFSTWLIYYSRRKINHLRRVYETFCSQRVLELISCNFRFHLPNEVHVLEDNVILRAARRDANFCGRVLQMQLEAVVPFITFCIALMILLYIRLDLSLLLIGLMAAASSIQYRINKSGAQMSSLMEISIVPATREKRELIKRLKDLSLHPCYSKHWIQIHFKVGATKQNLNAAENRRIATEKSKLISNILFSIAVFLVLLILGGHSFSDSGSWTSLLVYLVALRFCFANFQNVNSKLTSINRFYPQFRRYFLFINSIQTLLNHDERPIRYLIAPNSEENDTFEIRDGHRIGLISTMGLSRYSIYAIVDSLFSPSQRAVQSALQSLGFIVPTYGCLPFSLRNSFGFANDISWNDLKADYEESGLAKEHIKDFNRLFNKAVTIEAWKQINPEVKFVLGTLSLLKSDFQWLFFDGKALQSLQPLTQNWLLNKCADRKCVIVYTKNINTSNGYYHDYIVAIDPLNKEVIGRGSEEWYFKNQETIHARLKLQQTEGSPETADGLSAEEELEMEDM